MKRVDLANVTGDDGLWKAYRQVESLSVSLDERRVVWDVCCVRCWWSSLLVAGLLLGWSAMCLVCEVGGSPCGCSAMRVMGGVSARHLRCGWSTMWWSTMWVVCYEGGFRRGWSFLWMVCYESDLRCGWSPMWVVYDLGGLLWGRSSMWLVCDAVVHDVGGLLWRRSLACDIGGLGCRLPAKRVFCDEGGLSYGWPSIRAVCDVCGLLWAWVAQLFNLSTMYVLDTT